jgi:hypothetical protein
MLGHASAAMTLDVYSGLFDDDLDAVADRLDTAAISARVPRAHGDRPRRAACNVLTCGNTSGAGRA